MNTKHLNNLFINEIETPKDISNSPLNFTNLPTDKISTDNELFCNTSQSLPNNSSIPFDLNAASNLIYKSAVEFTLSLHNNNSFTRRDILNIQKNIAGNIIKPIATILDNIVKINIKDPMLLLEFSNVTSVISNPFKLCNSEYLLNKWLTENNFATNIQQFIINNEIGTRQSGDVVYDEKITKGILLPLQFQFKTYFEHNDNLIKTLNQIKELNKPNNVLSHFIQGKLWKQKVTNFQNKTVIPFFLYIDDVEINNPLGSHATIQLISAIYYSFPLLWNSSKLSNIFLAALLKSKDVKDFGNDVCFNQLIDEIIFLEQEGLSISTSKGNMHVHFILAIMLGDNLGINSFLEFSKSFSANYFCRFCKVHKNESHNLSIENFELLRNKVNYNTDIITDNFPLTSVYKESLLNKIPSFHVTSNYFVDVMHAVFEGVCHYDLCHVIKYYIEYLKLFSLEILNRRKSNFDYGTIEVGNICPPIQKKTFRQISS